MTIPGLDRDRRPAVYGRPRLIAPRSVYRPPTMSSGLSDAQRGHLEHAVYPRALAAAGELDSERNRAIAASDYWLFLQAGGGTDAEAIATLTRGLRACETR